MVDVENICLLARKHDKTVKFICAPYSPWPTVTPFSKMVKN